MNAHESLFPFVVTWWWHGFRGALRRRSWRLYRTQRGGYCLWFGVASVTWRHE